MLIAIKIFLSLSILILCFLVVIAAVACIVIYEDYRYRKYGLSLDEQFNQTMRSLHQEVQNNIYAGNIRLKQEYNRMVEQRQRIAELHQKDPDLYGKHTTD